MAKYTKRLAKKVPKKLGETVYLSYTNSSIDGATCAEIGAPNFAELIFSLVFIEYLVLIWNLLLEISKFKFVCYYEI